MQVNFHLLAMACQGGRFFPHSVRKTEYDRKYALCWRTRDYNYTTRPSCFFFSLFLSLFFFFFFLFLFSHILPKKISNKIFQNRLYRHLHTLNLEKCKQSKRKHSFFNENLLANYNPLTKRVRQIYVVF